MFNQLYAGEIKKLFRPKTLIVLCAVMVVLLILYAISYSFIFDNSFEVIVPEQEEAVKAETESEETQNPVPNVDFDEMLFGQRYAARKYTPEEVELLIAQANIALNEAKRARNENDFFFRMGMDPIYETTGYIKALEYIRDNNLYNQEVEIHSQTAIFSQKSAEAFAQGFFSILLSIIIIYGIVIGAGSFATEMKNGTLKMLFMRPITRNKLITAKILSLLTMITLMLLIGTLLSYLYGLIRFGAAESAKGLIVFNAMTVFRGSKGLLFFMNIMFGLLQAYALCLFAFAFSTVTRNRVLAIITCVLLYMGLIATILSLFKLGRFLFTTNANLGIYFGVSSAIPAGGNFFIALPIFIVYMAIFIGATYFVFNKRDVA